MWITASMVGYTSGATIVYLIPVGLMMLKQEDHKYLALGAMAGLISIPFAVFLDYLLLRCLTYLFEKLLQPQVLPWYI